MDENVDQTDVEVHVAAARNTRIQVAAMLGSANAYQTARYGPAGTTVAEAPAKICVDRTRNVARMASVLSPEHAEPSLTVIWMGRLMKSASIVMTIRD